MMPFGWVDHDPVAKMFQIALAALSLMDKTWTVTRRGRRGG